MGASGKHATVTRELEVLQVDPLEISFPDIEESVQYIQVLTVRNLGSRPRRIRWVPPRSPEFAFVAEPLTAVAPGLAVQVEVKFLTVKSGDFTDRVEIFCEDFRYEVPLCAKAPCAVLEWNPVLSYGTVLTRRPHILELNVRNSGIRDGHAEIQGVTWQAGSHIAANPSPVLIPARSEVRVKIELKSEDARSVNELVQVATRGECTLVPHSRPLHVYATVVVEQLHLLIDGQETGELHFGEVYHGKKKVVWGKLTNDGPVAVPFQVIMQASEEQDSSATITSPADAVSNVDNPLQISPFAGHVPAFSSLPIQLSFAPRKFDEVKGYMCTRVPEKHALHVDAQGQIECDELGQTISVKLSGTCIRPSLHVKPDVLYFGECPVNERRDMVLSLHNAHKTQDLDWSIPRTPHIRVEPSSGVLVPQQRADVIVSYMPKQLGPFKAELQLVHCGGMYSLPLSVMGEAPVIAEKGLPPKGVEKTGRDFVPEYKYVNPSALHLGIPHRRNLQKLTKVMKGSLWEDTSASIALDSIMLDIPNPTPYSLSPSAMQEFVRNRQKYTLLLRQQRFRRLQVQKYGTAGPPPIDIFHAKDVDIGMRAGSGLKSPRLNLDDVPVDKLWLQRPIDDDSGTRGVTGLRFQHDEHRFIKKKFKPGPTTQAEVHDASQQLGVWQLQLISTGPKILDFGTMYVKSMVSKSFTVFNDLSEAILVALDYQYEELAHSTPVSQLVPSAQPAGFDITLCSTMPQSFQRQVSYTINGHHTYKFLVKAEITPVQLSLSRSELFFRFGEDNLERTLTEAIIVSNQGNGPARFLWQSSSPNFQLSVQEGTVKPGSSMTLEVTFKPPPSGERLEGFLTCKIEDGIDQSVRCVGQTLEASCAFGSRKIDFGVLAIGLPVDKLVPVVNTGSNSAVFHVDQVPEGVTVTPVRGRIAPEGRADLNVHVQLDRAVQLDSVIVLAVRGGKPIRLPLTATAVVPTIEIVQPELEFGTLTLGAVSALPLSFRNSSQVEGTLYLNLLPYPEFSVQVWEGPREDGESAEIDQQAVQNLSLEQYQQALGLERDPVAATPDEEDEEQQVPLYVVTVPPNHTVQMQLSYQPTDIGAHYFEFPVSPAGGEKAMELRRVVHAEALRPRLIFHTTTADFKQKVVSSGQSAPSVQEIALHNADEYPLEWVVDTEPLRKFLGVFHLEPHRGVLAPEQDCLIRAAFLPSEPIQYAAQLPVYISPPRSEPGDEDMALPADQEKPYLYFRMKGMGAVPKLSFDRREVLLPIVPLGVRSRALFYLQNEGYESIEVTSRLPADVGRIPLSIHFPEGQLMGITKTKLPVELYFQSNKAMSFSAKIEFRCDNDRGSYSIPVMGTTDNSVLTVFPYLVSAQEFYTLEGANPVVLREKQEPAPDQGAPPSVKTGSQSMSSSHHVQDGQHDFLLRWLNANVLKSTVENFPFDLVAQSGRPIYEMVDCLAGKQIPKHSGNKESPPSRQQKGARNPELAKIAKMCEQSEEMLNFFKKHGALLAHVRPEHFLTKDLYVKYMLQNHPGLSKRRAERTYAQKASDAWMDTIYQCLRIFLLNRVTPKVFRSLPGMQEDKDEDPQSPGAQASKLELQQALDVRALAESNVYSVAEMILLRWVSYHYNKVAKNRTNYPARSFTNFDVDFQDGLGFGLLIASHVPQCKAVAMLKYPCHSPDIMEQNASSVVAALQEIGLPFPLSVQDILQPVARDLVLVVLFLFQNLPHYVPKTTIVFATQLNVPLTKQIELTNPSRKQTITYYAKLEGSNDFSIPKETLVLEPRQTVPFPVDFASRFTRPVEAQVAFTSSRQGNAHAAAMVFKLESRCTGRKPLKEFKVSAALYDVGALEIDVENPYSEDGEFVVSLSSQLVDENRNQVASKLNDSQECFHAQQSRLRLRANSSAKFVLSFLPLEQGCFLGSIGFADFRVGEFYYEVVGEATAPAPLEAYKVTSKVEETATKEVILPYRNTQLERAKMWLEARGCKLRPPPETIQYDVRLTSPFYSAPKTISVTYVAGQPVAVKPDPKKKGGDKDKAAAKEDLNVEKLLLEFKPREPGRYPCSVILTSPVDTRIYTLEGKGVAPNTKVELTFHTHARRPVLQEIPIVNPTDKDWTIKATFKQEGPALFDGPREFVAKKRGPDGAATTSAYPLTFKAEWVCDHKVHLLLDNLSTKETYEYALHGVAEEPLSEDHRVVHCEARCKSIEFFEVRNFHSHQTTFDVESDLMHIYGAPTVTVEGKGSVTYELGFQPLQAGVVTGCVLFKAPDGQYSWYTVELHVAPPKPQQTLPLSCVVRQAVAMDIELANPLDDVISFEVRLQGEGLLGLEQFVLAPREAATYELVYSPLLPQSSKGTAVFLNERVGEFWYDLQLEALPAPPEELPLLECELGRSVQTKVSIENPTGHEVVLKARSSNKINFRVVTPKIVLPALEAVEVVIEYCPSSLDRQEEAEVTFEHPDVGCWAYVARGVGLSPSEPRQINVVSQVHRPTSSTISFKNPFLEAISVMVVLQSDADRGTFSLLQKKSKLTIAPLSIAQIPFSFCPSSMTQHRAQVSLAVHGNLQWRYDILGVAEAPPDASQHNFTCTAREEVDHLYPLPLVGLDLPRDKLRDNLKVELEVPASDAAALARKVVSISLCDPDDPEAADLFRPERIALRVRMRPLKPFTTMASLVVSQANAGRWRFDVKLDVHEPEVDDKITIESPLNKQASVAFRLCNHTAAYAEFEAYFASDSAYEFTVSPTSGVLEPAGKAGTTFVVHYRPTEYGKPVVGRLIIVTEEVFWSYEVKGSIPKYSAPTVDAPRVSTRLTRDMQQQLMDAQTAGQKKNFIRQNLRTKR